MPRKRQQLGAVRLPPPPPPPPVSTDLVLGDGDLFTEILLRLPANSLIRFKSVCKIWVSLISSDRFCHHHTLRRPKLQPSLILQIDHLRFFYWNPTSNDKDTIIPYSLNVPEHQIVQECNGLLLLEFEPDRSSYNVPNPTLKVLKRNPKTSFYVYNPTTRILQNRLITRSSVLGALKNRIKIFITVEDLLIRLRFTTRRARLGNSLWKHLLAFQSQMEYTRTMPSIVG